MVVIGPVMVPVDSFSDCGGIITAGSRRRSWSSSWCSFAFFVLVILSLFTAVLLAQSFKTLDSTQDVAPAMAPSHLQMDNTQARLLPGFASQEHEISSQPWLEQGATAVALTDEGSLAVAAEDAVSDAATATKHEPSSSHLKAMVDMATAAQDQSAAGYPAAMTLKPSPAEESSASSGRSQSDALGLAGTLEHGGTMQEKAISLVNIEQSCVSCPSETSGEDGLQDAVSAHTTAATAAATAVEPAPGDPADPASTGHAVVVPDTAQLVCASAAHSTNALAAAVLEELAVTDTACPATAAAAPESDAAEVVATTDSLAGPQCHEHSSLLKPAEPLYASRLDMQADTDALAATTDSTDEAVTGSFHSNNAAAADHKLQECSSAVAAPVRSELAVAIDELFTVLPSQEDEPGVTPGVKAQSAVDQAQAVTSETVTLPSAEAVTTETSLSSPTRAGVQPDIGTTVALAAETLVLQQDQQHIAQDPTYNQGPHRHPQTTPNTEVKILPNAAPNAGPAEHILMTTSGNPYNGSILGVGAIIAADLAAVPALFLQAHAAAAQHSEQSPDTAELQVSCLHDRHAVTVVTAKTAASAAAGAECEAVTVQPDSSPQVAVLHGDEDSNADLAAELAAMMTLAESSSALPAQSLDKLMQSSTVKHCEDGAAAMSCTDDLGCTIVERVGALTTASAADMSMLAGNVGGGAASMCTAALQEVPNPKEQDADADELPAATAAAGGETWITCFVEQPAVDATTWHALLMEASWQHAPQLQRSLADKGKAFLITFAESGCMGLIPPP